MLTSSRGGLLNSHQSLTLTNDVFIKLSPMKILIKRFYHQQNSHKKNKNKIETTEIFRPENFITHKNISKNPIDNRSHP
jgi:hypothetical protein